MDHYCPNPDSGDPLPVRELRADSSVALSWRYAVNFLCGGARGGDTCFGFGLRFGFGEFGEWGATRT